MAQLAFDIVARDRASAVFDKVGAKADKTNANFSKVGGGMAGTFGKIAAAVGGVTVGWQAWDKVMVGGFNRLLNLDDARKRLDQMGLSTAQAEDLMAGLTDTVTGTAFSLDAGAGAMTGFVSAGVDLDKVNDRLEMTADTAAFAMAPLDEIANIFADIQTQGKLTGQELNMLQERGVPALVLLADAAGVTAEAMRDMISRGEIDAERFFQLWETGSQGFGENNIKIAGSAQSMGDTIRGSLANAETALARMGEQIIGEFTPAITGLAEGFTVAADAVGGFVEATGPVRDFFSGTIGQLIEIDREILEFFGIMEEEGPAKTFQSSMDGAKSSAEGMAIATGAAADALGENAEQAEAANAHLAAYMETLQAATDPVFALNAAIEDVAAANAHYNEVLADSSSTQADVEAAAFKLAAAVSKAEQAAINGDLSFADFDAKLRGWVSAGVLTAAQADNIRSRVNSLTSAAEDYEGNYNATVTADTSGAYTAVDSLVRWIGGRRATVGVNIRTFGGGALEFHQGGIIGAPRAHSGMLLGGLRADERIVIGQTGERILSRRQTDAFHELMSSMGRGNSRGTVATSSVPGGAAETRFIFEFRGTEDAFVAAIRKAIRVRGGDVQVVLGS